MREPRGLVYIAGPFEFPWGSASARRVLGVARSCAQAGYDVRVASADPANPPGVVPTPAGDGTICFSGLREFPTGSRLRHAYTWLLGMGRNTVRDLASLSRRPTHVLVYGGSFPYLRHLLPWCRRTGVPLLLDLVEWYDPAALPGGRWGPVAAAEHLARTRLQPRAQGAVVISTLLEGALRRSGLDHVALVPPTLEVAAVPAGSGSGRRGVVCGYAGTPGRKDDLGLVVRAVSAARAAGADVTLEVMGPDAEEVLGLCAGWARLPPGVRVLGRVPQQEVEARVGAWDFSVLVRADKRSSHAGFPTKFVESLAVGTPVIANLTSDLSSYLVDGRNGFVVGAPDVDVLAAVLRRAAGLDAAARDQLRSAARETGQEFDYRLFTESMGRLLAVTGSA